MKEYLLSLKWNSFEKYPDQGANIYLKCTAKDNTVNKFIKINNFNAVDFDIYEIANKLCKGLKFQFYWLPFELVSKTM